MIVPMKKVTVLCAAADREEIVDALGELGVVHLKDDGEQQAAVEQPGDLETLRNEAAAVDDALQTLPMKKPAKSAVAARSVPELSAAQMVDDVLSIRESNKRLAEQLAELKAERTALAPFGAFDPSMLEQLQDKGLSITLHHARSGYKPSAETGVVKTLQEGKDGVFFVSIQQEAAGDPPEFDAETLPTPRRGLAEVDKRIVEVKDELERNEGLLQAYATKRSRLETHLDGKRAAQQRAEVCAGMAVDGPVAWLEGYIPSDMEPALLFEARRNGWGMLSEPISIDVDSEETEPPTLLRNPGWVKPIKAVFDVIGITPGYREADVSGPMLFFLSIFFAMLVGDVGYGLIFLGISLLGRAKLKSVPSYVFNLLTLMSCCTIVWGAITGVYFGNGELPAALESLKIGWLTGENASDNIMLLTFLIGAVHLTLAHGWNVVRLWPDSRAFAQIGWICTTWTMIFAARSMVLLKPFPGAVFWALGLGIALIALFMVPPKRLKKEWEGLVMLPLNLISNFVDVVSYVRLFAVGAATYSVASAFNQMAADMGSGGFVAGLGAALILFFGHALNIILAAMGVLVHGIRLNTLEFAGHMGLKWTGRPYTPYAVRKKDIAKADR